MSFRYYVCPDCKRRGVHFDVPDKSKFSDDNYRCKYCKWFAICVSDEPELVRLAVANDKAANFFIDVVV